MHCENHNHHVKNNEPCNSAHASFDVAQSTPHGMHWHINKQSVKGWGLNFIYFGLHAVQIYLIIKLT